MGLWILNHTERAAWVLLLTGTVLTLGYHLLQGDGTRAGLCVGLLPFILYRLNRVNRLMR